MTDTSTLPAALLVAQLAMHGVSKTGRNQQQGWSFVTVEDVTRAAREALTAAGLVAIYRVPADQRTDAAMIDGYLHVLHPASGDDMRLPMPWPIERAGPQARRAAFSYARKQALVELLLVAEPDDPETSATTSVTGARKRTVSAPRTTDPSADQEDGRRPSDRQVRYLHQLLSRRGYESRESVLAYLTGELGRTIESSADLTGAEVSETIDALKATPMAQRLSDGDEPPPDPWATEPAP